MRDVLAHPFGSVVGLVGRTGTAVNRRIDRPNSGAFVQSLQSHSILILSPNATTVQPKPPIHGFQDSLGLVAVRLRILTDDFGDAGSRIVIEEFLTGPEVSVLAFTDGKTICPMVSSMDHKRAGEGDTGLNTGGMGTVAPNPYYTPAIAEQCMREIFLPTVRAMAAEGCPFKGCLYFGLMLTPKGPRVIEYNCRFGDPETQVVLPLLKSDLLTVMQAVEEERLDEIDVEWHDGAAACVILASGGYPTAYEKGKEIEISADLPENVTVYHAGDKLRDGKLVTSGGRVLGITAQAETLPEALSGAYAAVERIHFDKMMYRRDIGQRALRAMGE